MNRIQAFRLTAISVAVASSFAPLPSFADDMETLTRPESSISVGVGGWYSARPHLGRYGDERKSELQPTLDLDLVSRDDALGIWRSLRATGLGLETREIRGEIYVQGDLGLAIENNRTVRYDPKTYRTTLQGIGTDQLRISGAGAGNTFAAQDVRLGTVRDLTQVSIYKSLSRTIDLNLLFKEEMKSGTRQWGRGGQSEFAVEPIDSKINQVDAVLNFTGEKLQLSGGYSGSWYSNKYPYVTTLRTVTSSSGTATDTIYLSQPLDNSAHQLFLDGGYSLTDSTRVTAKLSFTRATQNDRLATKDIPGLSLASSPTSLDGKVDTSLVQLGLSSRPMRDLSVVASVRHHDVNDKTPQRRFVQNTTGTICGSAGNCVDNTPLSFETNSAKAEATYRLPQSYSVTAGASIVDQDRSVPVGNITGSGADLQRVVPFRSSIKDETLSLGARKAMSETINGSLTYTASRRSGSGFTSASAGAGGSNSSLINPIHIADRDRTKVRVAVDWTPINPLSLQFVAEKSKDDYDQPVYGVKDGEGELYSLDATYALSDNWKLNAWYARDKTTATQFNGRWSRTDTTNPNEVKEAEHESKLSDTGESAGLGVSGRIGSKVRVGTDASWSRNRSRYQTLVALTGASNPGNLGYTTVYSGNNAVPLTDVVNEATSIRLFTEYAVQKNADLRLDLVFERWNTNDYTWLYSDGSAFTYTGGSGSAASPHTDGTQVITDGIQTSTFLGLRYTYRFQ